MFESFISVDVVEVHLLDHLRIMLKLKECFCKDKHILSKKQQYEILKTSRKIVSGKSSATLKDRCFVKIANKQWENLIKHFTENYTN